MARVVNTEIVKQSEKKSGEHVGVVRRADLNLVDCSIVDESEGRWADGKMGRWADGEMGRCMRLYTYNLQT